MTPKFSVTCNAMLCYKAMCYMSHVLSRANTVYPE